jgi:uncharacterized protein (DUF58 family)
VITPRNRLLVWTGLVVVPFGALGPLFPETGTWCAAAIGTFLALVLLDAVSSGRTLNGVSLEFPETIRMIKDREGEIELRIRNRGPKARRVRLGLAFPEDISPVQEDLLVELPGGDATSLFRWPCTPGRRGRYLFSACYLEAPSRAGFWAVRRTMPVRFELRVYPDLTPERRKLAALFLNRGDFGAKTIRQAGQGREFEKLREYVHGDTYEHIHWKTTAKRGRPVTKLFQVERTQEVYVVVDASRLSNRRVLPASGKGPVGRTETVLERFITAALVMGVAAERQGDLFGVATFSDCVHRFVRAKNGRAHYTACRDAIYGLQPRSVTPDYNEICSFIGMRLRRRALIIFLTSLDDPVLAESFERNMDLLRKRHVVLVGMLRPSDAYPVFSRPDSASLDDLYRDLAGHLLWHDLRELKKVLQQRGVRFFLLDDERMCPQLISRYQDVKQRQLV